MRNTAATMNAAPELYIDFGGTFVGSYPRRILDSATASKVGFKLSEAHGEQIGKYAETKAELLLAEPRSAVQDDAFRLIREAKKKGVKVVIWTMELPEAVFGVIQRDGVASYVDRIATPYREYVLKNGELANKLRFDGERQDKASIIARADPEPAAVIGNSMYDLLDVKKAKVSDKLLFFKLTRHRYRQAPDIKEPIYYISTWFKAYEIASLDAVDRSVLTGLVRKR